jgi:hypothetical protein
MNIANRRRQPRREVSRWLPLFPGMPTREHTAPEVTGGARANSNGGAVTLLASLMPCLWVICFMAAGTHTALAHGSGSGLHAAPVPAACADDCIGGGARRINSACGSAGCQRTLPSRLAASKRVQPRIPARPAAQSPVAASTVEGPEGLFTGAGDMSAGSWAKPE